MKGLLRDLKLSGSKVSTRVCFLLSHSTGKLILLELLKYDFQLTNKRFMVWCEAFWTTYSAPDTCSFKYRNQIYCSPHVSAEYYPVQFI